MRDRLGGTGFLLSTQHAMFSGEYGQYKIVAHRSSSNTTRERHRIDMSTAPAMNRIFLARHCAGTDSLVSVWDVSSQVVR